MITAAEINQHVNELWPRMTDAQKDQILNDYFAMLAPTLRRPMPRYEPDPAILARERKEARQREREERQVLRAIGKRIAQRKAERARRKAMAGNVVGTKRQG